VTRDEERLMRYLDGEVDAAERREIEAWLAESKDARALCASLDVVNHAVRAIGEDLGRGGDGIADAVMSRIDADAPIVDLEARPVASRTRGMGRRFLGLAPALGLGLAAAAAVVVYFRPVPPPGPSARGSASSVNRAGPAPVPATEASEQQPVPALGSEAREAGASIESVDFGARAGTIFMVSAGSDSEDADTVETPVVWLMDEVGPTKGRMAPL